MNNNTKTKEEILAASRKLKQDEGVEYFEKQGANIGRYMVIFLVCVPLSIMSAIANQMATVWALGAVSSALWFGEVLANYHFTKQKSDLVKAICGALVLIAFIYWFITSL